MLRLEKQYITTIGNKSRLNFDFIIDGKYSNIWFEVDNEYAQYLCTERCDAFVIGVLPYVLTKKHNIVSEIPIDEELLYNLQENLIPILTKYDSHVSHIKLNIPTTSELLPNAGAVGTGVSAGIDSFNTILSNYPSEYKNNQLTHLCIFNVGSFGGNEHYRDDIREEVINRGKLISQELNLPLIVTNSNLANVFPRNHEYTHSYSSMFAVFCMQKLWKTYFYASATLNINDFSLINAFKNDSADYECLLFNYFSIRNLRIFSEGIAKNRLEKTEFVAKSPIVQKYLHVCTDEKNNCSRCSKCMRTILSLDAVGKLNDFAKVFDIEYYKKHKSRFYWMLFSKHYHKYPMMEPIYQAIKHKMPLWQIAFYKAMTALRYFIYDETYPERKCYIKIKVLGLSIKIKRR